MDLIKITRPSMPAYENYCAEIKELWESRWLTNNGVKHQELENSLREYLDTPNITLFANGHLAIEYVLAALELPAGGEVITTPFTFASTTHAIVRSTLMPVFCDINDYDYTIDANKIEALITEKTCAIMPVHVYGNLCDVGRIKSIAEKYKLKVIYDAAHAFGVSHNGVSVANFGDASIFSFHATKVFNTIEGGAVTYQDRSLAQILKEQKNFGIRDMETVAYVGGNGKMSEFHAAMGICNIPHVDNEIAKRKLLTEHYRERLAAVPGIRMRLEQLGVRANYAYFPVVFDNYKYTRDEVFERLKQNNIIVRKYFYPLTNSFACYKNLPTADADKTPVAKYISEHVLTLPLYGDLTTENIDNICDVICR